MNKFSKNRDYKLKKNYKPTVHDPRLENWVHRQTHFIMSELMYEWIKNRIGPVPTRDQAELILIDRIKNGKVKYEEETHSPA